MTPNKEDYLKCIHEIGERQIKITNKLIAEMMAVSAPSVSEMLKKMLNEEWIKKDASLGYNLTTKGQQTVSNLYRKHRLIEVFLVHNLGYTNHDIHEEAEVLEHSVTDQFIDRLEEMLNYPDVCPHGGVIPRKGQKLKEHYITLLETISKTGHYIIKRVYDNDLLLNYLNDNGLAIGQEFHLVRHDDFSKTWTINFNQRELTISEQVAKQLFVESIAL